MLHGVSKRKCWNGSKNIILIKNQYRNIIRRPGPYLLFRSDFLSQCDSTFFEEFCSLHPFVFLKNIWIIILITSSMLTNFLVGKSWWPQNSGRKKAAVFTWFESYCLKNSDRIRRVNCLLPWILKTLNLRRKNCHDELQSRGISRPRKNIEKSDWWNLSSLMTIVVQCERFEGDLERQHHAVVRSGSRPKCLINMSSRIDIL